MIIAKDTEYAEVRARLGDGIIVDALAVGAVGMETIGFTEEQFAGLAATPHAAGRHGPHGPDQRGHGDPRRGPEAECRGSGVTVIGVGAQMFRAPTATWATSRAFASS
jgi:hypothetical protein